MNFTDDEIKNLNAGIEQQNDELERLRAFAREILNLECHGFQQYQKERVAEKHGITAEFMKGTA